MRALSFLQAERFSDLQKRTPKRWKADEVAAVNKLRMDWILSNRAGISPHYEAVKVGDKLPRRVIGPHSVVTFALECRAHRQNIWLGVSAIAHFSVEPYPHEDIHKLAEAAAVCFRPERVLVGSDYPMFDKERYADYMRLAANWLTDLWPEWSVDNALFT